MRAVALFDLLISSTTLIATDKTVRSQGLRVAARGFFPLTLLAHGVWYTFLILGFGQLVTGGPWIDGGVPGALYSVVTFLAVIWAGPNVLRTACLHLVSSSMHDYGDVEDGNVLQ